MERIPLRNLFEKEKPVFKRYKETNPELFIRSQISEGELFSKIGISVPSKSRPEGYIRLYFHDFIVEEVSVNQEISEIEPKDNKDIPSSSLFTLYSDLVKVGISTSDAILSLAKKLGIKANKIGHSGLKDVRALTSQKIAFPNIDSEILGKIKELSPRNFFLTNFSYGRGSIQPGGLFGNRFTIFVRTKEKIEQKTISEKVERIQKEGFLNFYSVQRFGTPRFLSHFFGKLILQGKYEEAVFSFLFKPGLKETALIKKIREKAGESRNWKQVEDIFKELPYTFRNELRIISYLKEHPRNFIGALFFLEDQTSLWVYAYTSYLFNLLLSLNKKMDLPDEIPLLLSNNPKDLDIYKFWLEKDNIKDFQKTLKPFSFIVLKRRLIKSRIFPQELQYKILPEGIIISFILKKGAYATTFLMNLFEVKKGLPRPEWVKTKEYDIKKELKIGSVEKAKEILGEDIFKLPE